MNPSRTVHSCHCHVTVPSAGVTKNELGDDIKRSRRAWSGQPIGGWVWRAALVLWVIATILVAAPRLISTKAAVGPAQMSLSLQPARHGALMVDVPPLGSVSAPTHPGPVQVDLSIRRFNQTTLAQVSGDERQAALGQQIGSDLKALIIRFAIVGLIEAAVIGAAAAAIFPRRNPRSLVAGALCGSLVFGLLGASVWPGFDANKFKAATVQGSLNSASALVDALGGLSTVDARAAALSDRLADLYSAATVESLASPGDTVILHISDIHLNPIGLRLARQLAAEVGADAVIDTGDTTSFGLEFEGGFADLIKDFDIPYYWVAGNHDSKEVREAIARSAGVTPLDDRAVRIGALTVSGVDDPTFTALERPGVEEWAKEYRAADDRTVEIVESNRPDLLAVHNPVQAAPILGLVDTVIAGHTHRFSVGDKDGTTVEVVASSGATGLGSLLVEDDLPYGFSILRYDGDVLIAIDQAEFDGLDGSISLRRHIPGETTNFDLSELLNTPVLEGEEGAPPIDEDSPETTVPSTSAPETIGTTSAPASAPTSAPR